MSHPQKTPAILPPTQPQDAPTQLYTDDVPEAAALVGIIQGLLAARSGATAVNTNALIAQGAKLIREFQPRDHSEWATVAGAGALFWNVASTFQPRLAGQEVAARRALTAKRVTIRQGRRR